MVNEGQMAPMHFHWNKMEDIINRGGGNVLITVYNSTEDGEFADTDVTVHSDGRTYTVPAGTRVRLTPGESITIQPYLYHDFHVEEGTELFCSEKYLCATTTRTTTASMNRSEDSRPSRKMSLHTVCSAMSIRQQRSNT